MTKTTSPARIRKDLSEAARLITDPRLPAILGSVTNAKLFAKAKANPKALLAKHGMKLSAAIATRLRLSRELVRTGTKKTLCVQTTYQIGSGGIVIDENGKHHKVKGELHSEVCTTFLTPK